MKRLILARHAKSSWDYPELDDFERPLNPRGRKDAPVMAIRLKHLNVKPDLIWSSPAVRAVTTARIFAATLHFPLHNILYSESIYSDSHSDLIQAIKKIPDHHQQVMIVGHNPVLTSLVNYLIKETIDNVPTAGVVGISFNDMRWNALGNHNGEVDFFEFPKKGKS